MSEEQDGRQRELHAAFEKYNAWLHMEWTQDLMKHIGMERERAGDVCNRSDLQLPEGRRAKARFDALDWLDAGIFFREHYRGVAIEINKRYDAQEKLDQFEAEGLRTPGLGGDAPRGGAWGSQELGEWEDPL